MGAALTGGCHGFSTKYMHWHEDLIVGGIHKNRTGHIVRAEALQSIVQLMAEEELYSYYQDKFKVHTINWSKEKAKAILEAWQRKLVDVSVYLSIHPTILEDSSKSQIHCSILPFLSNMFLIFTLSSPQIDKLIIKTR